MKQAIYILIAVFGLLSCNNRSEKKTEEQAKQSSQTTPSSQTVPLDPSKIECVSTAYHYGDSWTNFSPGTFGEKTYLYNSTNSGAKIIDSLQFNSTVNILTEYPDFFLVCTYKGIRGYIKKTDLYLHSLFCGINSCTYLFGITNYGTNDNTSCNSRKLKLIKIHDKNTIIGEYHDSIMGKYYEIEQINNSALKNSDALFYISDHCDSEIGVEEGLFIVDNGKQLSRLISIRGSGDGGFSDESTVYLPVLLTNGKKIVLAKNGVFTIDETTAKPEIYEYPANSGIPMDELIVVQNKSVEALWDKEKKEPMYNIDGTAAEKITNVVTNFYQWNGTTIQKVKTIKGK